MQDIYHQQYHRGSLNPPLIKEPSKGLFKDPGTLTIPKMIPQGMFLHQGLLEDLGPSSLKGLGTWRVEGLSKKHPKRV